MGCLIRNIFVPCNKHLYNIDGALKDLKEIHYGQFINVQPGAIAYIYAGKPFEQALIYACKVIEVNETENIIDDKKYLLRPNEFNNRTRRYMKLRVFKVLDANLFKYKILKEHGLKSCMQGQSYVPEEVQRFIDSQDN